eukprot:1149247-Pelagomonas_calceolata.AAC.3
MELMGIWRVASQEKMWMPLFPLFSTAARPDPPAPQKRLGSCNYQSGKRVGIRANFGFNKLDRWVGLCQAEEPVLSGKTQSEWVGETFLGTSIPCSRSLAFWQEFIPGRDEPYLPVLMLT